MRINKYLSEAGVCSRRTADRHIEAGEVLINGCVATLGTQVTAGDDVFFKGKRLTPIEEKVVIAFHKPVGVECTASKEVPNNIVDYIDYPVRIFPVGRLDKNSEGLILLTNDGELANGILKARNFHEKAYCVKVNRVYDDTFIEHMRRGVPILDSVTRPCEVKPIDKYSFEIILTQGLNRQIRRMCEALGYEVVRLKRFRVLNIVLGELPKGKWRHLTDSELKVLKGHVLGPDEKG